MIVALDADDQYDVPGDGGDVGEVSDPADSGWDDARRKRRRMKREVIDPSSHGGKAFPY